MAFACRPRRSARPRAIGRRTFATSRCATSSQVTCGSAGGRVECEAKGVDVTVIDDGGGVVADGARDAAGWDQAAMVPTVTVASARDVSLNIFDPLAACVGSAARTQAARLRRLPGRSSSPAMTCSTPSARRPRERRLCTTCSVTPGGEERVLRDVLGEDVIAGCGVGDRGDEAPEAVDEGGEGGVGSATAGLEKLGIAGSHAR